MAREGARFGNCLIDTPEPFSAAGSDEESAASDSPLLVSFGAGALSPEQLRSMFDVLPFDLTFVDADDRVAFFSEGERVFPRAKAVIGRKVQFCHPPKSVHMVTRILDDFRAGRHDKAEFWIQMAGRFLHIRYFAVRDAEQNYQGTLEMTQDLTALRALEGQRRLLEYDQPEVA